MARSASGNVRMRLTDLDALDLAFEESREALLGEASRGEAEAKAYAAGVRERFRQCLEPLPAAAPANARVTGTIDRGSYRIDKVCIESVPGQWITANFYYPSALDRPAPGILVCCGHAPEGKAHSTYAAFCLEAVACGMCALIFDPYGQGERKAPSGATGEESYATPVEAHDLIDGQLQLLGEHLASHLVRECLCALDYLIGRSETDASRIGVTGNSGGGTQSAYLAALDDRIAAAAPCCYLTGMRPMLRRLGAQDAEQCPPDFLRTLLDHGDLIAAAAPTPYLIGADLLDFFPIDGTRDSYKEARLLDRQMGCPDRLEIDVTTQGHGFWPEKREAVLRFFCRHFDMPYIAERPAGRERLLTPAELRCMEKGADPLETGLLPLRDIRERAERLYAGRTPLSPDAMRRELAALLRLPEEDGPDGPPAEPLLAADADGGAFRLQTRSGLSVRGRWRRLSADSGPVLVAIGAEPSRRALLAEKYAAVVTVEPRGVGPADPSEDGYDPESACAHQARMLGLTLPGLRVADALAVVAAVRGADGWEQASITLHGAEEHALTALMSGLLSDVEALDLERLLYSFRLLTGSLSRCWGASTYVPGALGRCDIADLLTAAGDRRVRIAGVLDAWKNEIDPAALGEPFGSATGIRG